MEIYNFSKEPHSFWDKIHYRIQQIEFHWRNLWLSDKKMIFFRGKAKVAWSRKDVLFGGILSKLILGFRRGRRKHSVLYDIWEACDQAAYDYIPKVYQGKINQFRPFKQYACFNGPELGWEKLADGELETYDLPVYPRGMLVEPFVPLLAEKQ